MFLWSKSFFPHAQSMGFTNRLGRFNKNNFHDYISLFHLTLKTEIIGKKITTTNDIENFELFSSSQSPIIINSKKIYTENLLNWLAEIFQLRND